MSAAAKKLLAACRDIPPCRLPPGHARAFQELAGVVERFQDQAACFQPVEKLPGLVFDLLGDDEPDETDWAGAFPAAGPCKPLPHQSPRKA